MRRQHKTALLVLLLAVGLLGAAVALWPREPTCQGKRLSQWLEDLDGISATRMEKASAVLREMGTNAIPGLLTFLRAKDSRFKAYLITQLGTERLVELGFPPAQEHRNKAVEGFALLGSAAKPAIPALIRILNDGDTAGDAASVLVLLGQEGMCALTNAYHNPDSRVRLAVMGAVMGYHLEDHENGVKRQDAASQGQRELLADLFVPVLLHYLEDQDPDVRTPAAEVLGALEAQPERVVPALVKLLKDGELYPRSAAVQALGDFGTRAKAAVPALVEYARGARNMSERDEAIKALKEIDPEAAVQTGLEREMEEPEGGSKKAKVTLRLRSD